MYIYIYICIPYISPAMSILSLMCEEKMTKKYLK